MTDESAITTLLRPLRDQIDDLDQRLFTLLAERMGVARDIGRAKLKVGQPIVDHEREAQMIANLSSIFRDVLAPEHVELLAKAILQVSHAVQNDLPSER